jgi:DNA-directed RNA polymerase specialized sigma subunit
MIRSEAEYREAVKRAREDQESAAQQRAALSERGLTPEQVERAMEPLLSFHAQLNEEIAWYERVRRGDFEQLSRLTSLGRLLIALRIATGLTQRQLAEQLGVSEAQVSRDERNEYHGITVDRAQRIVDALGATLTIGVQQPPTARDRLVLASGR